MTDEKFIYRSGRYLDSIETDYGILYTCKRCALPVNVFLRVVPAMHEVSRNGELKMGVATHPVSRQCKCSTGKERVDVAHILMELHRAMSTCKTLDEAIRLVWKLASQEEMSA